jgi:hypothetical protein
MAEKNPMPQDLDAVPTAAEKQELQDEALVLDRLLVKWPVHLQESDLQRELKLGDDKFDRRDRVERAVQQLDWAGMVVRCGPVVIPTRSALQYDLLSNPTTVDL